MNLLIFEDRPIIRRGFESGLKEEFPSTTFQFVTTVQQAKDWMLYNYTSIFMLSLRSKMNDVTAFAINLKETNSMVKVAALVDLSYRKPLNRLILAKVDGIFSSHVTFSELKHGLQEISRGHLYRQLSISQEISDRAKLLNKQNLRRERLESRLTKREKEVLKLITKDFSTSQIANSLCLSKRTIEGYRQRIFEKTGCKTPLGLLRLASQFEWSEVRLSS